MFMVLLYWNVLLVRLRFSLDDKRIKFNIQNHKINIKQAKKETLLILKNVYLL